jgi:hypothetical protein
MEDMNMRLLLLTSFLAASMATGAVADCASERQACQRATSALAQCGARAGCGEMGEAAQRICTNAEIVCRSERQDRSRSGAPRY